jgi:osmoprotectant transport system permease protein
MSFLNFAWSWLASGSHWRGSSGIPVRVLEHLGFTALAVLLAIALALPLGIVLGHLRRGNVVIVNMANIWRAIPTLGLVVLIFVLWPFSVQAWLVPLTVLGIPPILTNAYEGVAGVDPDVKDAALGQGMTQWQLLWKVEVPIAMPLIVLGLRTATIFVVSTATVAAYIGLGGLGRYIIDGLAAKDYPQVAGGAVVIVVLALAVQLLFVGLRRLLVPPGLRAQARASR